MKTLNLTLFSVLLAANSLMAQSTGQGEEEVSFWFQKFLGFQIIELVISLVAIIGVVYVAYAMSKVKKKKRSRQ